MPNKIKVSFLQDELFTLKELVKLIMTEDIQSRNSDRYLIAKVYLYITDKSWWTFNELLELPNPESIIRIRAKIQNQEKILLPTEEVNKFRATREVEIREIIKEL